MKDEGDEARRVAQRLIELGGSQPGFQAAPRRRPPSYELKYFNSETGEYDIDVPDDVEPPET